MSFIAASSLELQLSQKGGVALLELKGRLDSSNAHELDSALSSLINDGTYNIIVSCESLRYISSAGLSVFLKAFRKVSEPHGGHFVLCAVANNINRVLQMTGFADFIPLYSDPHQARMQLQKKGGS